MTDFLVKKFVKKHEEINDIKVRESYGTLSSVVGIICNIILFIAKFIMGTLANSISIVSDAFNNLSDCASCVVTLFGYKMAAKPADKDHPFGHGRFEYLTSLVIAMVIVLVGFELFMGSFDKIFHPSKLEYSYVVLTTLIISIAVQIRYSGTTGIDVYRLRKNASGTDITQTKQLSKITVIIVFPPERSVK